MRYASIRDMDISNGTGVGASIFFQGCSIHCKNCFQPQTWDFNGGYEWTEKETEQLFEILRKPYISRFTLVGGEPLDQAKDLSQLLYKIRQEFPNLKIWIYSGRTLEENMKVPLKAECLSLCDVLVDGAYVDELRDLTLAFRGSSNQRIIDLKKTFESSNIVLYDLEKED
jgi:anaerobic ribonucleoside-triphosphate reductase activating protein